MRIAASEVQRKRKIGTLGKRDVYQVDLLGGLTIICATDGSDVEYLGAAPHPAISRHLAKTKHSDLNITVIEKSDQGSPATFQHMLKDWEGLADQLNAAR